MHEKLLEKTTVDSNQSGSYQYHRYLDIEIPLRIDWPAYPITALQQSRAYTLTKYQHTLSHYVHMDSLEARLFLASRNLGLRRLGCSERARKREPVIPWERRPLRGLMCSGDALRSSVSGITSLRFRRSCLCSSLNCPIGFVTWHFFFGSHACVTLVL